MVYMIEMSLSEPHTDKMYMHNHMHLCLFVLNSIMHTISQGNVQCVISIRMLNVNQHKFPVRDNILRSTTEGVPEGAPSQCTQKNQNCTLLHDNPMNSGPVPIELQGLSQIDEMLISSSNFAVPL